MGRSVLGPWLETTINWRLMVIMTDCYSKLVPAKNLEAKGDAYSVHYLRSQDCTIRDTSLLPHRQLHKIDETILPNHLQLSWVEAIYKYCISPPEIGSLEGATGPQLHDSVIAWVRKCHWVSKVICSCLMTANNIIYCTVALEFHSWNLPIGTNVLYNWIVSGTVQ